MDTNPARMNVGLVALGAALVAWGLLLTLHQTGVIYLRHVGALWPLLIAVLGMGKIAGSATHRGRRSGMWLLVIGLWLSLSRFTVFGYHVGYHETWPLLVVAAGAIVVWDVLAGGGAARSATEDRNGR